MEALESLLGTLEPTSESSRGLDDWIALIGCHPRLAAVAPVDGTNPFTGQALRFAPRRDTARVLDSGSAVGYISLAEDDSGTLDVWSLDGSRSVVEGVATEVARLLGWSFIRAAAT